jgi:hypothetical protein
MSVCKCERFCVSVVCVTVFCVSVFECCIVYESVVSVCCV